jgi:hypothetical protein
MTYAIISETYSFQGGTITNNVNCHSGYRIPIVNLIQTQTCDVDLKYQDQEIIKSYTHNLWLGNNFLTTSLVGDDINGNWTGFGIAFQTGDCRNSIKLPGCDIYDAMSIPNLTTSPIDHVQGTTSAPINIWIDSVDNPTYSTYSDHVARKLGDNGEPDQLSALIKLSSGMMEFFNIILGNPILIFAIIEIGALIAALQAKDPYKWWMKWIDVHLKALGWIKDNYQIVGLMVGIGLIIKFLTDLTSIISALPLPH